MELLNYNLCNIGERIKTLRKSKGLKQEELAIEMGVTRTVVGKWETGYQDIKTEMIIRIARFFKVSCDYILTGVNTENTTLSYDLGLNESAINEIMKINRKNKNQYPFSLIEILNDLTSNCLYDLCDEIAILGNTVYMYYLNEYKIGQIENERETEKQELNNLKNEKYITFKNDVLLSEKNTLGFSPPLFDSDEKDIKEDFNNIFENELISIDVDYHQKRAKYDLMSMSLESEIDVSKWKINKEINNYIKIIINECKKKAGD